MFNALDQTTKLLKGLEGDAYFKRALNREYLMYLRAKDLLLPFYIEAGLIREIRQPEQIGHWGWDAPTSEIRGTVAGHFLSAAARIAMETGDEELLGKANYIVSEIARCQKEHGGEWAFSIPEKHMYWLKNLKRIWAPQYVCHKIMMGLLDMYRYTGNEQALEVVKKAADWFYRFTDDITRERMDEMMEIEETGGIMEYWADLYAVTGDEKHLTLMRRYERPLLFDPILRGEDVLTNMHANTTIPEIHGAARAYEVTGEERYRKIVENYWDLAVTKRGMYATGSQTSGEVWTPMGEQAARLSDLTQEHCVVFNMMRLADYLLRWTGNAKYADYWERNLLNGIFAQGYWQSTALDNLCEGATPDSGLVAYYLPLRAGSWKKWGSKRHHFWCCHCTLLQANANVGDSIFFKTEDGVAVAQYINGETSFDVDGTQVSLRQTHFEQAGDLIRIGAPGIEVVRRPDDVHKIFDIQTKTPVRFALKFRAPEWNVGPVKIYVNGELTEYQNEKGFLSVEREWKDNDQVRVVLSKTLRTWPLPDMPNMVAFMDGPVVLAGLVDEERLLYGNIDDPKSMLTLEEERRWMWWRTDYRTIGQERGIKFIPIADVGRQKYTVYFPVSKR